MLKTPAELAIATMDLTDLQDPPGFKNEADPKGRISKLCELAVQHDVAAVCVNPQSVKLAKKLLRFTNIKVATVVNFPTGDAPLDTVLKEIDTSLAHGADEIDVVMPYQLLQAGKAAEVSQFLTACKTTTVGHSLKVIIESGKLTTLEIREATQLVCQCCGPEDFVKTSTGKATDENGKTLGATPEAVEIMLSVLAEHKRTTGACPGIKVAGGVKVENFQAFLEAIQLTMGAEWMTPDHVRIGASALLNDLVKQLTPQHSKPKTGSPLWFQSPTVPRSGEPPAVQHSFRSHL